MAEAFCSAKADVRVDFDFRGTLQANNCTPGNHHRSLRYSCMGEVDMVRRTSRSWLDNATIVQCQDNHFVDFRLEVTPMSQERPHNLRRRRFLQQTPGEFVPRNLYPFCKLKDLLLRQIPSSEEENSIMRPSGPTKPPAVSPQRLSCCF